MKFETARIRLIVLSDALAVVAFVFVGSFSNDDGDGNRPLPSSENPHFQNEARCTPFLWKWVLFTWEWKIISISKAEHLSSFWSRGPGELGNGLLEREKTISLMSKTATLYVHHAFLYILCRHCTTTTWRCLFSRFMEDVDKRRFFLSSSTKLKLSIESYFVVFRYELRSKLPEISVFHWRVIQCSFPVPN